MDRSNPAAETADIADEIVRLIIRRVTEGAGDATIAAGFAFAFQRVADADPGCAKIRQTTALLLAEQILDQAA